MARGSVRRHDGGWGYRVDLGADPSTGKRRQASKQGFRTKREAELAMQAIMRSSAEGKVPQRSQRTVGAFLDEWLVFQRDRLRPSTYYSYGVAIERIKAGVGMAKLQSLTPLEIERFYHSLGSDDAKSGLAPKTVRNTHVVLRKALSDAERLELVTRNPAASARPPSPTRTDRSTWNSEQLREFLDGVEGQRLFAAFVLLATTGMRRGEVVGLRWRDVDFDAGDLAVANTLTTAGSSTVVSGPPKTPRSRRQIFLDDWTLDVLRTHRRVQAAERLSAGPAWNAGEDYVFTDEVGNSLHPDSVSRRFHQALNRSCLPRIRLHDLRHSYATVALKAGVHPKVVSERLGHATVGVTLDLYSHVTPSIARDAASVVASKIRAE
jgi:integrase